MLTDSTRETRNVEHPCSSMEGLRLFSPRKLEINVINNLVIFAVLGLTQIPQTTTFISGSSQTPEHCISFTIFQSQVLCKRHVLCKGVSGCSHALSFVI